MIRRQAARLIEALYTGGVVWAIGHLIRGPEAKPSVPRDFGAGGLVVGGLLALGWAREAAR
jgi:hypothetical protein